MPSITVLTCLTPFTLSSSIQLLYSFRIMQARLMPLPLHQPHSNSKLSIYIRFTHKRIDQPRFYIGSTANNILGREPTRNFKFKQVVTSTRPVRSFRSRSSVLGSQPAILRVECRTHLYPKNQTLWALEQTFIQRQKLIPPSDSAIRKSRRKSLTSAMSLASHIQDKLVRRILLTWSLCIHSCQVSFHQPSNKIIYLNHPAIKDALSNHKMAIQDWPDDYQPNALATF